MLRKALTLLSISVMLIGVLAGCGATSQAPESASVEAALKITGSVAKECSWTEAELEAMDTAEAQYTNKEGVTETYTGVPLNALLDLTGVQADTATLVFVAADGYTAEAALADVQACAGCIVAFQDQGGLRAVLPGFPGKLQVRDLVEIQVK